MATKKSATKKRSAKKSTSHANSGGKRKWSAKVGTDSTHPRKDLFNQSAPTIARELASKKVSPKGPGSGMRMLTFYINRAGKNLPESRLKVLQRAKELLHKRVEDSKTDSKPSKKTTKKSAVKKSTRKKTTKKSSKTRKKSA
ncbi:MAG: DUF3175 domain-containing protein [Acidobacteria bacterium]|nr:DUF3175 domain-containing protein [Acidobacteriota bacterium]